MDPSLGQFYGVFDICNCVAAGLPDAARVAQFVEAQVRKIRIAEVYWRTQECAMALKRSALPGTELGTAVEVDVRRIEAFALLEGKLVDRLRGQLDQLPAFLLHQCLGHFSSALRP